MKARTSHQNRLKAATLVESLAALVLVLIAFGCGIMILMNVLSGDRSISHFKADLFSNALSAEAKEQSKWVDHSIETNIMHASRTVHTQNLPEGLLLLTVSVSDAGGKVLSTAKYYAHE